MIQTIKEILYTVSSSLSIAFGAEKTEIARLRRCAERTAASLSEKPEMSVADLVKRAAGFGQLSLNKDISHSQFVALPVCDAEASLSRRQVLLNTLFLQYDNGTDLRDSAMWCVTGR